MAKCIGISATECRAVNCSKLREELDFLKDDLRLGEQRIELTWFERIKDQICDISNTFEAIKSSCLDELDKWDCGHLQESLNNKLSRLTSETQAVLNDIIEAQQLPTLNKHRYFILFSYGTVNQLETLLRTVGRLSEIQQKIFFEDQCKPLVCEESILIHSLTSIWSNSLSLMHSFKEPADKLFNANNEQEMLIQSLDFSTTSLHYHKLFLMDLIATSWLQFNRLSKLEQLITQLPFLCPCHTKQYFKTLESLLRQVPSTETHFLSQLLPLILAPQSKPSMMTQSIRQYGVTQGEALFSSATQEELAYFVVWHLYAISRIISDHTRPLIKHCQPYLLKCAAISLEQFLPTKDNQQTAPGVNYQVSPHQEERLSLLLLMLNSWYEKNGAKLSCLPVVTLMFSFFDKHWTLFNHHYFDNSEFRIAGLTVFQHFTKIIDEVAPLYTVDGHAPANTAALTREEKQLKAIWDRIVERKEVPSEAASGTKKISVSQ